eukprot:g1530.t1
MKAEESEYSYSSSSDDLPGISAIEKSVDRISAIEKSVDRAEEANVSNASIPSIGPALPPSDWKITKSVEYDVPVGPHAEGSKYARKADPSIVMKMEEQSLNALYGKGNEGTSDKSKNGRESWMTALPSNNRTKVALQAMSLSTKGRVFRPNESNPNAKIDSSWLDNPKEREKKKIQKDKATLFGNASIKRSTTSIDDSTKQLLCSESNSEKKRPKTLLERYQKMEQRKRDGLEKKQRSASIKTRWDRDRDMAIGSRRHLRTAAQVEHAVRDALTGLSDRFG